MTRYALIAALLVAVLGSAYGKGRVDGKAALQARIEAAEASAREAMSKAEAQRLIVQAERDRLAREMEDLANAEPVRDPAALPDSRRMRIDAIQ